jgi:hypothetical protein
VLASGKVASSPSSPCSAHAVPASACARLRVAPGALLPFAARVGLARVRSMGRRVPPAGSPRLGWARLREGGWWIVFVMGPRKRCTECRQWYEAASSARDTQKVCGAACRQKRRRGMARQRRWAQLPQAREEERERQRSFRAAHRAQTASAAATPTRTSTEMSLAGASPSQAVRDGPGEAPRHAPPSSANGLEILGKVLECWDREMARSRATLQRRIAGILRRSPVAAGTARDGSAPLSRATLGL